MSAIPQSFPRGTVIEWFTKYDHSTQRTEQKFQVMKPKCANAGQLEHAGECSCAPDPASPEVVAFREAQAKLEARINREPRGRRLTAPAPVVVKSPVPKPQPKRRKAKAAKRTKKQTRRRRS